MAPKIFVVVDHVRVRAALRRWLEMEFPLFRVGDFGSAEEALMRICNQAPELIIMDIDFPQHDGIAVLRRLKAHAPEVPIVILTILDDDDYRAEAQQAGSEAFISTQKMHEELIPKVTELLSQVPA